MSTNNSAKQILSGDVCTIHMFIRAKESKRDEQLYLHFNESKRLLRSEVEKIIKKTLGDAFEVRKLDVLQGSVEIFLLIGTTYYAVSKYKNLIDSIDLLTSQLKNFFSRFASNETNLNIDEFEVTGGWSPNPALQEVEIGTLRPIANPILLIVLLYILLSHAVMLGVIVYQLLNK